MHTENGVFGDCYQALTFYREQNPARQKYINLFEPDGASNHYHDPFSENHPHRVWCRLSRCVDYMLKEALIRHSYQWLACHYWVFPSPNVHKSNIARACGRSERQIERWIARGREDLEEELIRKGLLPRNDED